MLVPPVFGTWKKNNNCWVRSKATGSGFLLLRGVHFSSDVILFNEGSLVMLNAPRWRSEISPTNRDELVACPYSDSSGYVLALVRATVNGGVKAGCRLIPTATYSTRLQSHRWIGSLPQQACPAPLAPQPAAASQQSLQPCVAFSAYLSPP